MFASNSIRCVGASSLLLAAILIPASLNSQASSQAHLAASKDFGMNPFWGWSSLAYVMPLEYKLNYDPTDLNGAIKPIIPQEFGVRLPPFNPASNSAIR
jgi:hypothetical protein